MFGVLLRQTHVFELWKGPESCIRYKTVTNKCSLKLQTLH